MFPFGWLNVTMLAPVSHRQRSQPFDRQTQHRCAKRHGSLCAKHIYHNRNHYHRRCLASSSSSSAAAAALLTNVQTFGNLVGFTNCYFANSCNDLASSGLVLSWDITSSQACYRKTISFSPMVFSINWICGFQHTRQQQRSSRILHISILDIFRL